MNEVYSARLKHDFPELYRNTLTETCFSNWNFQCGDGWFDLIYKLSKDICEASKNDGLAKQDWPVVVQCKEKFGQLRVYTNGCSTEVRSLIEEAQNVSATICESCGKPGKLRTPKGGWWHVKCNKCELIYSKIKMKTEVLNDDES